MSYRDKMAKNISLTAFRHRSESFRLESITVADSVTYISRLDIAMDDSQLVRCVKRLRCLFDD